MWLQKHKDAPSAMVSLEVPGCDMNLIVACSRGRCHATFALDVCVEWYAKVCASPTGGKAEFNTGGQGGELPNKWIVTPEEAIGVVKELFAEGTVDLGHGWERI